MKIPLFIEKEDERDCGYGCPFRSEYGKNAECLLFKQPLEIGGYYDSIETYACTACREFYRYHKHDKET